MSEDNHEKPPKPDDLQHSDIPQEPKIPEKSDVPKTGDFTSGVENLTKNVANTPQAQEPFAKIVENISSASSNEATEKFEEIKVENAQENTVPPAPTPEEPSVVAAATSPAEILAAEILKEDHILPIPPAQQSKATDSEATASTEPTPAASTTQEAAPAKDGAPTDIKPDVQVGKTPHADPSIETQAQAPEQESVTATAAKPDQVQDEPTKPKEKEQPPSTALILDPKEATEPTQEAKPQRNAFIRVMSTPSMMMLMSSFLFASMILFVKKASDYYSSFEIIMFRGLVGVICIVIFQQVRHGFKGIVALKTAYLGMQTWRAFIGTMSMVCWFYGISKLTLVLATTLSYMSSIWMAIFIISTAFITGKSRPSPKLIFSILMGFGGILVVLRPSGVDVDMFAAAIVVISSVFTALAYMQVAALGRLGEPAYRTVFYFCLFGVLFGLVATLVAQGRFSEFSWVGMAWLLPIGILAMVAQLALTLAYTGGNALVNASLQYSGLIFAVFFDLILGTGWPDYYTWLGMGLVVLSGLLATFVRARKSVKANG